MISFSQELLGGCGFSLIPPEGLHATISANPLLLLLTKSVMAYAKKQSRLAIFRGKRRSKNGIGMLVSSLMVRRRT